MTDFEPPFYSTIDPGVNLPTVPPILSDKLRRELELETWQQLEFWRTYCDADLAKQALIKSIIQANLDNVTRHVKHVGDRDVKDTDVNRIARGLRPQSALLLRQAEGIDSVELMARLVSDEEEPHNALSTVMAERALQLVLRDQGWQKPFGDKPRSRLKVTRLFPMVDPQFAIIQAKLDHADIETTCRDGRQFVVKGRRSGFVKLSELPADVREGVVSLADFEQVDISDPETPKHIVAEYLKGSPKSYRAVVDRAYAARIDADKQG